MILASWRRRLLSGLWRPRRRAKGTGITVWRTFFRAWLYLYVIHAIAAERVVILTPHVDAIRHEFGRGFARWHEQRFGAKAEVDWRNVGGTSDALRFLRSEFANKPDGVGLDILFGGGQEPYLVLVDQNFAAAYDPPPQVLERIPQTVLGMDVYEKQHRWFAAALSSFGILQNTHVQRLRGMAPARRWADLADPKAFGWVGVGDPRNSGTMTVMFESFLQAYGWEKGWQLLTCIGGNTRNFDRVSSTTAKDVTLGETAYAFAIDFYAPSQITVAGRTNMHFVLPEDFTAINADCIAILKGAPHRLTAERFVEFVLSEDGQRLWFLPNGSPGGPEQFAIERMSVRPDFYQRYRGVSHIEFSPFQLKQSFTYNSSLGRDRREIVAGLAGALLVDPHPELKAAWRAIIRGGLRPEAVARLGLVPLSEAEALRLASGEWTKPAVRNAKKIEWQTWARQKYRTLCE